MCNMIIYGKGDEEYCVDIIQDYIWINEPPGELIIVEEV